MKNAFVVGFLALVALSLNGCSSSSSAQAGPSEPFSVAIPGNYIPYMSVTGTDKIVLNIETGNLADVWVHDLASGETSLLMADAKSLLLSANELTWQGHTFLRSPAFDFSDETFIWMTDGTVEGTHLLVTLTEVPPTTIQLRDAAVVGDRLILNVSEYDTVTQQGAPSLLVVDLQ